MNLAAFGDWFDEVGKSWVRIVLLVAVVYGTADYFGWGVYGLAMAVAFETLAYILIRQIVRIRSQMESPALTNDVRASYRTKLWSTSAVALLILSFLSFNQYNYLLSTWHPAHELGPVWLPYLLRAVITPVGIYASSWLTPAPESLIATIERESMKSLREFLSVLRVQRKKAIDMARKGGHDLTHAITAIADAAGDSRAGHMLASVQSALRSIGSGEPVAVPVVTTSSAPSQRLARGEAERLAREHYRKGMTVGQLAKATGLNQKTAAYWHTRLSKPKPTTKALRPAQRKGTNPRASA